MNGLNITSYFRLSLPWGGRHPTPLLPALSYGFQSTPSVGRTTKPAPQSPLDALISIHALRGEGDRAASGRDTWMKYFNPRPPWGGRRLAGALRTGEDQFQSTPSVGRATFGDCTDLYSRSISIHALRGEGDRNCTLSANLVAVFQSTPSVGRATRMRQADFLLDKYFNPRPPWGGRQWQIQFTAIRLLFQSTPSVGRATRGKKLHCVHDLQFQSTPSVGRATFLGRLVP